MPRVGYVPTPEHREKLAASHRGRRYSDEHRAAMRRGWQRRRERLQEPGTREAGGRVQEAERAGRRAL